MTSPQGQDARGSLYSFNNNNKEIKMVTSLYVLYDKTAQRAGTIFQAVNDDVACRNAALILRNVDFYDDFYLYRIGSFDDSELRLESITPHYEVDFMMHLLHLIDLDRDKEVKNDKKGV